MNLDTIDRLNITDIPISSTYAVSAPAEFICANLTPSRMVEVM